MNVAQPATNILPNYADPPPAGAAPGVLPAATAQPLPESSPAAQPAPVVAAAPAVQGVEILRQAARSGPGQGHPLVPVIQWCDGALAQMEGLVDYTCTFKKREFIDGHMQEQQSMYVKARTRPLSVYFHFLAPRDVHGQEAIYVEGRNQGRLLAHPVGIKKAIVGTVNLAPTDPQAMEGNRHPITDFGIRKLCERYREGIKDDLQFGECNLRILESVLVEGRQCVCVEITHPVPRQEFKFNVTRLFIDAEWNIPCRFEAYAWPSRPGEQPMLVEEYTYANLKLNVNLTDADFDVRNPNYQF